MAKAAGHEVVHLRPYHSELNPIELAWSQVKRYIKENNQLFTLTAVKELKKRPRAFCVLRICVVVNTCSIDLTLCFLIGS